MADELGFRFILQDEPAQAATGSAAPSTPQSAIPPNDGLPTPELLAEQYREFQQLEGYRRAVEEEKEEARAAKESAREQEKAAREQQAAQRKADAEEARNASQQQTAQERLEKTAGSATGQAQNSILSGLSNLPIFGQTISVMQQVARPLIDAASAMEAIAAAQSGGVTSSAAAALPAPPPIDVGGSVPPVAVPAGAAGALGVTGPLLAVGAAAAAGAVALYAAVKAANALDNAFQDQAKRLSTLNADLSAAQAQSRVEGLLQDVQSARTLGSDLADFTTSRSSIDRSLQRITDVLSKAALEKLNPLLEGVATTLEVISKNGPALEVAIEQAAENVANALIGKLPVEAIKLGMGAIQQQAKKADRNDRGDLFTMFMDIPDLGIEDAVGAGVFQTTPVSFDAVGGSQLP